MHSSFLSFDEGLLYNFFEDSTVDVSQWRVVLNALQSASSSSPAVPRFNEMRHAGVCSEVCLLPLSQCMYWHRYSWNFCMSRSQGHEKIYGLSTARRRVSLCGLVLQKLPCGIPSPDICSRSSGQTKTRSLSLLQITNCHVLRPPHCHRSGQLPGNTYSNTSNICRQYIASKKPVCTMKSQWQTRILFENELELSFKHHGQMWMHVLEKPILSLHMLLFSVLEQPQRRANEPTTGMLQIVTRCTGTVEKLRWHFWMRMNTPLPPSSIAKQGCSIVSFKSFRATGTKWIWW